MAGAALVAALAFVLVAGAVSLVEHVQTGFESGDAASALLSPLLGLLAVPFVVPGAFLAGVVAWRRLVPAGASARRGALAGVVTVLGTYLLGGVAVAVLGVAAVFAENVGSAMFFDRWRFLDLLEGLSDGAWAGAVAAGYALFLTWWLAFPLGAAVGWRHQRVRPRRER
jgi:hypothetical protein